MTVVVVGEALIDIVTRADGQREEHVGGSPLNVAVGLARLGVPTSFASQIGDDARGRAIERHLQRSDVDFTAVGPRAPTSTATATLSQDGSATYVFEVTWNPEALPDPLGFDAVHVGSLGAALAPGAAAVVDLVAAADARGIPVSFDPNVRLAVEQDVEVWRHAFSTILPHTSHLKLSDEDAHALFPGVPPDELVRSWAGDGRIAAITCGAEGSHLAVRGAYCRVPPAPTNLVDTIGAGDSWMAALLTWSARHGWPAADALDDQRLAHLGSFAAAAAALTCSRPGADPPWLRELAA